MHRSSPNGFATPSDSVLNRLGDRRDTTVIDTHHLRQKHPERHRGIVYSCRHKNRSCLPEDRKNSLLGHQRSEVRVAILACMIYSAAKRIKENSTHRVFPCVGYRHPNSAQVTPLLSIAPNPRRRNASPRIKCHVYLVRDQFRRKSRGSVV